jgi:hypothetical protein
MLAVVFITVATTEAVHAQTTSITGPQFLMTWQALNTYAPPSYAGKVLPNQGSQIVASLEVISKGSSVSLAGQTIYWYLNDNLLGGGVGIQKIIFRPYGTAPNTLTLKVELPDYPGGLLAHEIAIPVVQPQAVIETSYPQNQFTALPVVAQALPYFFNASSAAPFSFTWSVNGQPVTSAENPQTIQIALPQSTPPGFAVAITLNIKDANDSTVATANANLVYQKQL